jgi:ribosomal protein S18 acetylase RimI-like enzyme
MSVDIRPARLGDVDAIVKFGADVVPPHYAPILGESAAQAQLAWWTYERMRSAVEAGDVQVAVAGGEVVGVAETGTLAGDRVLWKVYLAPHFRGRSLGRQLLRQAIAALPEDTEQVFVEHFAGNVRAGAFYEREGFTVVRREPSGSGDPQADVVWRRLPLQH